MRSPIQRLPGRGSRQLEFGGPIPDLERGDLELLAVLAGVGLVPFVGLALGIHEGTGKLLLGAALAFVCGGQLLAGFRRSSSGGRPHGLRVPRPRPVLLRGHLGPGAAVRPPVRGHR